MSDLRKFARGQECAVRTSQCSHDPATVVLAHAPHPDRGMAFTREVDWWGAHACHACHDLLDGRREWNEPYSKELAWFAAVYETQKRIRARG